jgi:hypothetical protein
VSESTVLPRRRRRTAVAVTGALVALLIPAAALADGPGPAADVPASSPHAEAVAWALEHGVSLGCTDTTFCPGDPITREQAASMLMRLSRAGIIDADTIGGLDLADLDARFGGAGERGPAGPQGPAGADGTSADLTALTDEVDALTAEVALLRYGAAVVTVTLSGQIDLYLSSPATNGMWCNTSCEYLTYPGHAVSAAFSSYSSLFHYTCGGGPEQVAEFQSGGDSGWYGSCDWPADAGGIPAGATAIAAWSTL